MYRLPLRLIVVAIALTTSLAFAGVAFAMAEPVLPQPYHHVLNQDHGDDEEEHAAEDEGHGEEATSSPSDVGVTGNLKEVALWTSAGIAASAIFLTAFYMLKRKIGLFDNPEWVAPITILYSKDAATEGTFGDSGDSHGSHGSHH